MNKFLIKILKVILILTAFSINKKDSIIRSDILMSVIYIEAVKDLI